MEHDNGDKIHDGINWCFIRAGDDPEDDEPVVPLSREDILEDIRTNGITDPDPEVVAAIEDHFGVPPPTHPHHRKPEEKPFSEHIKLDPETGEIIEEQHWEVPDGPEDEPEDDEPVVPLSREDILEDIRTNGITDP